MQSTDFVLGIYMQISRRVFLGRYSKDAMWNTARVATKNSFDFHMDELKKLDVKAYEWLVKLDVRT